MSHQHAAVSRSTGLVEAVVVIDPETVVLFAELGVLEGSWPGCDLVDVTGLEPAVGIGWTHLKGEWAPPAAPTEAELAELIAAAEVAVTEPAEAEPEATP